MKNTMDGLDLYLQELEAKDKLKDLRYQKREEWIKTHLILHVAKRWYKSRTRVGKLLSWLIKFMEMETDLEESGFLIEDNDGQKVIAKITFDEQGREIIAYRWKKSRFHRDAVSSENSCWRGQMPPSFFCPILAGDFNRPLYWLDKNFHKKALSLIP